MNKVLRLLMLSKRGESGPPPEPKPWEIWEENTVKEVLRTTATATFNYTLIEHQSSESAETLNVTATASFSLIPV